MIVESPGSIAELGAFSVKDVIAQRLMVAVRRQYNTAGSFISLGPISYLKKLSPKRDRVFVYPWGLEWDNVQDKSFPIIDDLKEISPDFIGDLIRFDSENEKTGRFDIKMKGHISLIICDLIGWFPALKLGEIKDLLEVVSPAGLFNANQIALYARM